MVEIDFGKWINNIWIHILSSSISIFTCSTSILLKYNILISRWVCHLITDLHKLFASHMFALGMVVCEWLYSKLLCLTNSFCCSFWARCSDIIVDCSLCAAWSHRASSVLIIHSKIMIKFCMWFQNTLRPLVDFIWIFCSFNHLNSTMFTIVEIRYHMTLCMASPPTSIYITVINHSAASSSMVITSWLLKTSIVCEIMSCSKRGKTKSTSAICVSLYGLSKSIGNHFWLINDHLSILFQALV